MLVNFASNCNDLGSAAKLTVQVTLPPDIVTATPSWCYLSVPLSHAHVAPMVDTLCP